MLRLVLSVLLLATLAACATAPEQVAPVETRTPPSAVPTPVPPVATSAPVSAPPPPLVVTPLPPLPPPVAPVVPVVPPKPQTPPYLSEAEGRARVTPLIAPSVKDRAGWATDIFHAFAALRLAPTRENFCSTIAVIEQESNFQADPTVPGLPKIALQGLYDKGARYGVPSWTIDLALLKRSPDGRSYRSRIAALRTEKDVSALYAHMVAELPDLLRSLGGENPIHTAGPMQVSVAFAEQQVREKPYPYPRNGSVRDELFTRRGGVYFGAAILLDYPAPYTEPVYRFADFNAGRYSSRNAAFQAAVARLTRRKLDLDGDLLRYQDGVPAASHSDTATALLSLAPRLGISPAQIEAELKLEKTPGFEHTALWQRVFALADAQSTSPLPRARLPGIALKSPKIHRKLTTEWFARRVLGRYNTCLARP